MLVLDGVGPRSTIMVNKQAVINYEHEEIEAMIEERSAVV